MNVLLVDDEATIRKLTKRMLQSRGVEVFDAASGEDALALSEKHAIDVLVTDMVMDGMDGAALAESLLARHPDLPVLFISGYPVDFENERRRFARCAFLAKPYQSADLMQAINDLAGAAV